MTNTQSPAPSDHSLEAGKMIDHSPTVTKLVSALGVAADVTEAEVRRFQRIQQRAGTEDALDDLLQSRASAQGGTSVVLNVEERAALERFAECCEDDDAGGHDVPKTMMARLAEIGVVRRINPAGYHTTTEFGNSVLATPPATTGEIKLPWPWTTEADLLRDAITHLGHQPRIVKAMDLLLQRAEGGPVKCPGCDGSGVDGDCGPDGQAIDVACEACNGTGLATTGMKESLNADIVGAAHLVCDDFGIPPGNLMGRLSVLHVRAPTQESLVGDAERPGNSVLVPCDKLAELQKEATQFRDLVRIYGIDGVDAAIRAGRKG